MNVSPTLNDITIRTELKPGDIGYITYLHGVLYNQEYGYSISFEAYVAAGLYEFLEKYDPEKDCAWLCEHNGRIVGSMILMDRNHAAQLRYFLILPEYRSIGLGKHLMNLYMQCLQERNYKSAYLLTTHELYAAASLYKRHGFILVEEVPSSLFGKSLLEQRYELRLSRH